MKKFEAQIVWRDPSSLIPYALNAKTHPQSQVDKIAASIAAFGFDQPIAVDGDGVIIKGHGRYLASLKLGLAKVPVVVRDDLTEAEKKAARIADNKTAESAWDRESLAAEFEALAEMDADLCLTGFSQEEFSAIQPAPNDGYGDEESLFVPEKDDNIQVRLTFHPGLWLGKREEVMGIIAKMEKAYSCKVKVDE